MRTELVLRSHGCPVLRHQLLWFICLVLVVPGYLWLHDFPSFDEAAIYIENSKKACWSFRTWQMLVKLPTQTCKSQQVCWLNSHSLDCFRVWICLYFHPPELSLWSQWCSYVIGVSSSISHTYIEAGTPSNDIGMHLYYIYIFIKFLYTYIYL